MRLIEDNETLLLHRATSRDLILRECLASVGKVPSTYRHGPRLTIDSRRHGQKPLCSSLKADKANTGNYCDSQLEVSTVEIQTVYEFIDILAILQEITKANIDLDSDVTSILRPRALSICTLGIEDYVSVLERYGWERSEFTGPISAELLLSMQEDVEACFQERISNEFRRT